MTDLEKRYEKALREIIKEIDFFRTSLTRMSVSQLMRLEQIKAIAFRELIINKKDVPGDEAVK